MGKGSGGRKLARGTHVLKVIAVHVEVIVNVAVLYGWYCFVKKKTILRLIAERQILLSMSVVFNSGLDAHIIKLLTSISGIYHPIG